MLEICEKYAEYLLQYAWSKVKKTTCFTSINRDKIEVLYPGTWNTEAGPDFKSAELIFNGKQLSGDIEIHLSSDNWKQHGHSKDKRYDNVVLHVVKSHKKTTQSDYSHIPILVLPKSTISGVKKQELIKYPKGFCVSTLNKTDDDLLHNNFVELGIERFKEKSKLALYSILRYGIEKTYLRSLFDACGYKTNRDAFHELFERFTKYNFDSFSEYEKTAVLWGESNLLPDISVRKNLDKKMIDFINNIWNMWWKLRRKNEKQIKWNLNGIRPLNNPCRRVAALSLLLNKPATKNFHSILENFLSTSSNPSTFWKKFKQLIICNDSLWNSYINFTTKLTRKSSILGENRALDIVTNVILPLIYAYSQINRLKKLEQSSLAMFQALPSGQINILLKISMNRWALTSVRSKTIFNTMAAQQGIVHLYKNCCEKFKMDCEQCSIYKNPL